VFPINCTRFNCVVAR